MNSSKTYEEQQKSNGHMGAEKPKQAIKNQNEQQKAQ